MHMFQKYCKISLICCNIAILSIFSCKSSQPTLDTSSRLANFPQAIAGGVAFVLNNEVYVGLGSGDGKNKKDDFYKWDGSKWAAASNMKFPQAIAGSVAFVLNNEVYVGLGSDDGKKTKTTSTNGMAASGRQPAI